MSRPTRRTALLGLGGLLLGALLLAGCGPTGATVPNAAPATLVPVRGSTVQKVVLTPLAAQRLILTTTPVREAGGRAEVPITAVIYDPAGRSWTYVPDGALSYLRHPISILRYDGDTAVLSQGPAAGTPVVVVSAPELLGAEYGVGEE